MVIQFSPLTKDNNVKDLSETVNSIGTELTKSNNIFTQVDSMSKTLQNVQQFTLTNKDGYSKVPGSLKSIRDLREAGYYYISASTLATLTDAPPVNSDVVITVMPSSTKDYCIQYLHTLRASINPRALFRYATPSMSTEWLSVVTTPLTMNTTISDKDLNKDIIDVGTYYFYNLKGVPTGITRGFLDVRKGQNDLAIYEVTNASTALKYTSIFSPDTGLSSWVEETTLDNINDYTIASKSDSYTYPRFGLYIHKADNISFEDAIQKKLKETNQGSFTFYCQGGVTNAPSQYSTRGLFISDTPKDAGSATNHGVYYAIETSGKLVTGALSSDKWSTPKKAPSIDTLWTGNKLFTDTSKTEKLSAPITDYDCVEIFIKPRVTTNSSGDVWDVVNNEGRKFYIGSDTFFIVSGTIVDSKAKTIGVDHYRVDIRFSGDTFKIDGSATINKKAHYVTRIVGHRN